MTRRDSRPRPPFPMQYRRDWAREVAFAVGFMMLTVGALLVVGISVTS